MQEDGSDEEKAPKMKYTKVTNKFAAERRRLVRFTLGEGHLGMNLVEVA